MVTPQKLYRSRISGISSITNKKSHESSTRSGVSKLFSRGGRFDSVKVTEGQQFVAVLFCATQDAY